VMFIVDEVEAANENPPPAELLQLHLHPTNNTNFKVQTTTLLRMRTLESSDSASVCICHLTQPSYLCIAMPTTLCC